MDFNVFFSLSHYESSAGERASSGTESLLLSEGPELATARAEVREERLFCHGAGLLWGLQALLPGRELDLGLVFVATVRILCAWIQCGVQVGF